jgi:hypothetical protein
VSVDPLVGATGEAYGYGGNNPISYSDPTGLEKGANGEAQAACSYRGYCQPTQWGLFDDSQWLSDYYSTGGTVGADCFTHGTCIKETLTGLGAGLVVAGAIAAGPIIAAGGGIQASFYGAAPAAAGAVKVLADLADPNPNPANAVSAATEALPALRQQYVDSFGKLAEQVSAWRGLVLMPSS